ncbi:MAG: acyl-CoA dehydrogenase family protein [Anaerolineae bacterium]|nr:acyl-CoA dehydrogenase family protein [Anaerolineae bacterium]
MDFALTDEQRMFQKMFADFAEKEVKPIGEQADYEELLPMEVLQKAAMQGFMGALFPEECSGACLDFVSYIMLLEELAKADVTTAMAVSVHNGLAGKTILDFGSAEQREKYLEPMAFGEMIGAFALTEPAAGSDAAALESTALRDGDDYVLNGNKIWVSNGGIAGLFVVFAKTDPGAGAKGISAFIVERDAPGLKVGRREKTLGLRGLTITPLYMTDCRVPAANLLGEEGQGFKIALQALNVARLSLSAVALGACQRAVEEGIAFSIEHTQFGGPIALKQAIQNFVADSAAEIEGLRWLVYHTAWLAEQGEPFAQEAAIAKLLASEAAFRIANRMVQVHGGYGYMKEYAIERIYRDTRALPIIEGANEVLRFVIARDLYDQAGLKIKP